MEWTWCDSCYSHLGLLEKLLSACITCVKPQYLDLPIGLVGRLVLSGAAFIDQFVNVINSHNVSVFVSLFCRDIHTCTLLTAMFHLAGVKHIQTGKRVKFHKLAANYWLQLWRTDVIEVETINDNFRHSRKSWACLAYLTFFTVVASCVVEFDLNVVSWWRSLECWTYNWENDASISWLFHFSQQHWARFSRTHTRLSVIKLYSLIPAKT